MKHILFLLAALIPFTLLGQKHIDKTREEVKKMLENAKDNLRVSETDSTIVLAPVMNEDGNEVTWTYGFDSNGKCEYAKLTSNCSSCFEKELQSVLSQTAYQWKKINENQYVSKFESKLLLEISPEDNQYFFKIFRANWTKEIYDMLKGN